MISVMLQITVKAIEKAAKAAKASRDAISSLQAFLKDRIGKLPEEQMSKFLAAWRCYVCDAALFVKLCAAQRDGK